MPICVKCDSRLTVDDEPYVDEIVLCDECGAVLTVTRTDPVMVAPAVMADVDWGD